MITKREAIRETKSLWEEIEESGQSKSTFLFSTEAGKGWVDKEYESGCPLCEYTSQFDSMVSMCTCDSCPLVDQGHGTCTSLGYYLQPPDPAIFKAIKALKD